MLEVHHCPREPIIALDEIQSEEALLHPLELATDTVVEAFSDNPVTRFLVRPGEEAAYLRALLSTLRQRHCHEVLEAGDFSCVAFVREVPPCGAAGQGDSTADGGESQGGGSSQSADASRAAASANIEAEASHASGCGSSHAAALDPGLLRDAVGKGSLSGLLALGVPRLEAEMLVRTRADRLDALERMRGLEQKTQRYAQEHGPLLALSFLATRQNAQRRGLGRAVLKHLERMSDAEGRAIYLEASDAGSRRLYLRHGFEDVEEFKLSGEDGPSLYIMVRPPGAKSSTPSAEASEADLAAAGGADI